MSTGFMSMKELYLIQFVSSKNHENGKKASHSEARKKNLARGLICSHLNQCCHDV